MRLRSLAASAICLGLLQAFVVKNVRDDGLVHVARVTAAPEEMARAMNLAEVILTSLGPVLVSQ